MLRELSESARIMRTVLAACLVGVAGCSTQHEPMTVEVTQLAPYEHAAKPPDCQMPVLNTLPLTDYEQVAIVEAWADIKDQNSDVLPALQRKACETGADALVVLNSTHQDIKNLLYRATPNEAETDMDSKNGSATSGQYIQEAEHTRRIGEAGHNGLYIDAVAINYRGSNGKAAGSTANPAENSPSG